MYHYIDTHQPPLKRDMLKFLFSPIHEFFDSHIDWSSVCRQNDTRNKLCIVQMIEWRGCRRAGARIYKFTLADPRREQRATHRDEEVGEQVGYRRWIPTFRQGGRGRRCRR